MKLLEYNENIIVSVCLITYNQQDIIGDVLEYILNQKTSFKFEIVIGEDCSHDKTKEICINYKNKYPEIINLISNKKNLGLIGNFTNVISNCQGKYIAICAGDDFWIDDYKLEMQVDFLNDNPYFSMCSGEAYYNLIGKPKSLKSFGSILYNNYKLNGIKSSYNLVNEYFLDNETFWKKRRLNTNIKRPPVGNLETVLEDLFKSRYYPASANLIKREVIQNIPQEAFNYKAEHIIIIIWASLFGRIKLFKDVMVMKNALLTSLTVNKVMQKRYKPGEDAQNYIEILKLALKQNINHENKQLIKNKIEELSKF